jgi:hypothetical protein
MLLIGGLIVALSGAIVAAAMPRPMSDALPVAIHHLSLPRLETSSDRAQPSEAWQETALDRPLFALDRHPLPIEATADGSLPRLAGTIRFANTALAIFEIPAGADPMRAPAKTLVLGTGADVAGWTIDEIANERILLIKGGKIRALQLSFSKEKLARVPARALISTLRILHDKKTSVFLQP